ncbi:hypothetical protein Pcinc_014317 [Petrolisthes cinctipes]|uniref:Uncharacterized protein n=1 Tax=Petrolisthes cinctipes TaxID=88211 RepID=A0AAE1FVK7_PETCI|nr:hypothetical protein Pcinc_014317 [Petrolisthes cinctipes]
MDYWASACRQKTSSSAGNAELGAGATESGLLQETCAPHAPAHFRSFFGSVSLQEERDLPTPNLQKTKRDNVRVEYGDASQDETRLARQHRRTAQVALQGLS